MSGTMMDVPAEWHQYLRQANQVSLDTVDSFPTADHPSTSTTFGLFRQGTELRAIYCKKKPVARSACASLGTQCDYPILLG